MNRLSKFIVSLGKHPCVWNEAINAGTLTKEAVVYGWESVDACRKATREGYSTIVMPGHYFYFDMRQSQREPGHNWAAIFDASKVLAFDFEKEGFTAEEMKNVAGIQASFFSELYISHLEDVPTFFSPFQVTQGPANDEKQENTQHHGRQLFDCFSRFNRDNRCHAHGTQEKC